MRRLGLVSLLTLTLALAGFGFAPASDAAISRAKANALALKALRPAATGQVVVFGLAKPVAKGSYVFEDDTGAKQIRKLKVKPTRSAAWLFWEDLQYGAKFEHPSKLLLLDAKTGKRLVLRKLKWWPLLNGRKLAFDDAPGYWDLRYQVFAAPPAPGAAMARRVHAAEAAPIAVPNGAFANDCVIDIGRYGDARTRADFNRLDALEQRLKDAGTGLRDYTASSRDQVPKDDKGKPTRPANAPDGNDLKLDVNALVHQRNCKDIFIYIDGHGAATGVARVQVGGKNWKKAGRPGADGSQNFTGDNAYVTADDLRDILKAQAQTTFKIKIDACYAARFLLDLPKDEFPNLLTLETSSNAMETSLFATPERTVTGADGKPKRILSPTNNPGNKVIEVPDPKHPGKKIKVWDRANGLSEFSNGNFSAFEKFITDPNLVAQAQAAGGSLLARALEYASQHSDEQDFAAQQQLTHPKSQMNTSGAPAPPPPSPKASDCEQKLTATLTTPTSGPGTGVQHVQIVGRCLALLPKLKKLRAVAPAGKQISGYDAHSPSCVPDGGALPTHAMTCVVKSDGRICILLYLQPPAAAGDVLHVQLLGDMDAVFDELDLTVPSGQQPTCQTGDA